jgi:hypothetical protein
MTLRRGRCLRVQTPAPYSAPFTTRMNGFPSFQSKLGIP